MKKFWIGLSTCLILLASFVACKAALEPPVLGNKPRTLKPGHVLVKVSLKEDSFPTYRTVVPNEWTDAEKGALTYKITKESKGGDVLDENIKWEDLKNGYFIDLSDGEHSLVLIGEKDGAPVLISNPSTIKVPGAGLINFILAPCRDETNAPDGSVKIDFIFLDPEGSSNVDKVEIELKERISGTTMPKKLFERGEFESYKDTKDFKKLSLVEYRQEKVKPGVYNFIAKLLDKDENSCGTAVELVIVDPANISSKTIKIDYDLKTKPHAPSNLRVKYLRPTADDDTTYNVEFSWQDNSYNEDNFVLEVLNEDNSSFKSENANANETNVKVEGLELGKKYKARIKAINTAGESDLVDLISPNTNDLIHLARIKYNLDKGKVISVPSSDHYLGIQETTPGKAIGYYTQTVDGFMLPGDVGLPSLFRPFNASGSSTNELYIFKGWYDGPTRPANGNLLKKLKENEYGELELTAAWDERNSLGIEFPFYNDECYIEGSNFVIDATKNEPKKIIAKVIPGDSDYKIEGTDAVKWLVEGEEVQGGSRDSETSAKLDYEFSEPGFKHVMVIIKLTVPDTPNKPEKWVSAYCYVRVK